MRPAVVALSVSFNLLVYVAFACAYAGSEKSERWYADKIATSVEGRTEVRMRDGSRCDILTRTHAIEVDFARKWAEAIGQSLLYSSQTGKTGGIALIVESPSDERFVKRLASVIRHHGLPIEVLTVRPLGRSGLEISAPQSLARWSNSDVPGANQITR